MHFDEILSCIQSLTQDVSWCSIYVLCPEVLYLNADLIRSSTKYIAISLQKK